jgi:hypothetical protein
MASPRAQGPSRCATPVARSYRSTLSFNSSLMGRVLRSIFSRNLK